MIQPTWLSTITVQERARDLARALTWRELGDGEPEPAGRLGGAAQVSDRAYARRWIAELPSGKHACMRLAYYVQRGGEHRDTALPEAERLSIGRATEYLICDDPADPHGTSIDAEVIHDEPYDLRDTAPTAAKARAACAAVSTEYLDPWPDNPDRLLALLTYGLLPVTDAGFDPVPARVIRYFIGKAHIGTVTRVHTDSGPIYLAHAHDWDNGGPLPLSDQPGEPGDEYDPILVATCQDESEAVREVVTRVPTQLSFSLSGDVEARA